MKHNYLGRITNSPNESRVPVEYIGTLNEIRGINKVASFISKQGWNVIFEHGAMNCAEIGINNVVINSKEQRSNQLNIILHEAGHVVLFSKKNYKELYPNGDRFLSARKKTRTLKHKIDIIREEIAAWDLAESLIKKLDISIDLDRFRRNRNKCIKSYLEWSSR